MLHEKIKTLRKSNHLTQEELAEKIGVSRQAITKWESNLGMPDISNLEQLAKVFHITIDELLSEGSVNAENVSRTEFDVFEASDFHLNAGIAHSLEVITSDMEKIVVEISSDLPRDSYKLAKVKLTDGKHVDLIVVEYKTDKKFLDIKTDRDLTKNDAKNHLFVKLLIPDQLTNKLELEGTLEELYLHSFASEKHVEFSGKVNSVRLENLKGKLELDTNSDLAVTYDGSLSSLEINQIRAISTLTVPKKQSLNIVSKGKNCRIVIQDGDSDPESTSVVELNGFHSELSVNRCDNEA